MMVEALKAEGDKVGGWLDFSVKVPDLQVHIQGWWEG